MCIRDSRGGLAGAGAAGEDKAVLGHGLTDGFLLERRVSKALRQFQYLDVRVEGSGRLLPAPGQHLSLIHISPVLYYNVF